jgi:hypothetical protein
MLAIIPTTLQPPNLSHCYWTTTIFKLLNYNLYFNYTTNAQGDEVFKKISHCFVFFIVIVPQFSFGGNGHHQHLPLVVTITMPHTLPICFIALNATDFNSA